MTTGQPHHRFARIERLDILQVLVDEFLRELSFRLYLTEVFLVEDYGEGHFFAFLQELLGDQVAAVGVDVQFGVGDDDFFVLPFSPFLPFFLSGGGGEGKYQQYREKQIT